MALLVIVEVREGFRDTSSSSLSEIAELVQVGFIEESKRGWLKALTTLSKALSMKLDGLEILSSQTEEAFYEV